MIVDGNNFISHYLKNNLPLCAGKYGGNELQLLYCYKADQYPWGSVFIDECEKVAGLYPCNRETIRWFGDYIFANQKHIDLLALWNKNIPEFENSIVTDNTYKCQLQHLEPYFHDLPWSDNLEGKNVLVVSPFSKSIQNNFKDIKNIWPNKLSFDFNLITLQYPTSIPITKNSPYTDSREIFEEYKEKISDIDYDVAIYGTGFTGLMFAIESKKQNKTGIHLGGATQILFGVKGKRWDENAQFADFFNSNWTYPLPEETPELVKEVEGGCYW